MPGGSSSSNAPAPRPPKRGFGNREDDKPPGEGTPPWPDEVSKLRRVLSEPGAPKSALFKVLLVFVNIIRGTTKADNMEQNMHAGRKRGAGEACCETYYDYYKSRWDAAKMSEITSWLATAGRAGKNLTATYPRARCFDG